MEERPAESLEAPTNELGEGTARPGATSGEGRAGSGWTSTKQAAKALGVSRRTVQSYVRRGLLEAREDGEGVNKTFYVSIDSLNALRERRRREAEETANFEGASPETTASETAGEASGEASGEALRMLVERIEARTSEAAMLRMRLELMRKRLEMTVELTEKTQSTLREELERERRQHQDDVERERAERLEAEQETRRLREKLEAERSKGFWRRLFGG